MDIWETRLANMRLLADEAGSNAELARRLGIATTQMHAYIGKTPTKRIGDAAVKRATEAFNLPHGWFDVLQTEGISGKAPVQMTVWPFAIERSRFDALPMLEKERIGRFLKDTVETWEATQPKPEEE
ncbi:hypothetical protein [Paraburkholderia sp. 22B1P]|uniref:hypothetical protein n=1 Tax=Paraburkholderia sp. 22B1P TaxID=3080498 RepID=UPI003090E596|nr:helix-turn-helix transcriptional regulator [Paraburkholderia sp. 22B1P]